MSYRFHAKDEQDTVRLAEKFAARMEAGTVIALDGDLGAGKTRFSQAVGKAVGVTAVINSPTFTIIKEYEGKQYPFYHMDVYRIVLEEADELGLDEYFYGEGITLVEWASQIEPLLPAERLSIYIHHLGGSERFFEIKPIGEKYESWCVQMKENGIF